MNAKVTIVHRSVVRNGETSAIVHARGCGDIERDVRKHSGASEDAEVPTTRDEVVRWASIEWHGDPDDTADLGFASCVRGLIVAKPKSIIIDRVAY